MARDKMPENCEEIFRVVADYGWRKVISGPYWRKGTATSIKNRLAKEYTTPESVVVQRAMVEAWEDVS